MLSFHILVFFSVAIEFYFLVIIIGVIFNPVRVNLVQWHLTELSDNDTLPFKLRRRLILRNVESILPTMILFRGQHLNNPLNLILWVAEANLNIHLLPFLLEAKLLIAESLEDLEGGYPIL